MTLEARVSVPVPTTNTSTVSTPAAHTGEGKTTTWEKGGGDNFHVIVCASIHRQQAGRTVPATKEAPKVKVMPPLIVMFDVVPSGTIVRVETVRSW